MKKVLLPILMLGVLASFVLSSCGNFAAIVDDGNHEIFTWQPVGPGTETGSGKWGLLKNSRSEIFDIQVWGDGAGKFDYMNGDGFGKFVVTEMGGGWIGGGLVPLVSGKTFDFSKVSKMTFEIRGNINPKAWCLAVQAGSHYPGKESLFKQGINSLSTTEWTKVTLDVSGAKNDQVINAFMLLIAQDWGGSFSVNDYFEIRNLDYLDASGKSVTLKLK